MNTTEFNPEERAEDASSETAYTETTGVDASPEAPAPAATEATAPAATAGAAAPKVSNAKKWRVKSKLMAGLIGGLVVAVALLGTAFISSAIDGGDDDDKPEEPARHLESDHDHESDRDSDDGDGRDGNDAGDGNNTSPEGAGVEPGSQGQGDADDDGVAQPNASDVKSPADYRPDSYGSDGDGDDDGTDGDGNSSPSSATDAYEFGPDETMASFDNPEFAALHECLADAFDIPKTAENLGDIDYAMAIAEVNPDFEAAFEACANLTP